MNLQEIKKKFEEVKTLTEPKRSQELGNLMTAIENTFNIPLLKSDTTENDRIKPEFILYIEISQARDI